MAEEIRVLGKSSTMEFAVKRCDVEAKQITCFLTVTSPTYDRRLNLYDTHLIDADGDNFPITNSVWLTLDRNHPFAFKLLFDVNKDVARPLNVRMKGLIDDSTLDKEFEVK